MCVFLKIFDCFKIGKYLPELKKKKKLHSTDE